MTSLSNIYTEIINKREAEYVTTLSYQDFFKCFPPDKNGVEWKVADMKEYHKCVIQYLKTMIKNNFEMKINYKASDNNPSGRVHAKSSVSLQRIHKPLRAFLTKGLYRDYDMKNAHPTILLKMCEAEGLATMFQKHYIENRDKILKANNVDKKTMLIKLNSDSARANGKWCAGLRGLVDEWNNVKMHFYNLKKAEYKDTNAKNPISSIINKMLCEKENEILQKAIPDAEYIVPMYDGFLCNKQLDIATLPNEICLWDEKPIETDVKVPDDFVFVPQAEVVKESSYADMKEVFEKTHAKIVSKSLFVMIIKDIIYFKTKTDLIVSYEHLSYSKWVEKDEGGYYKKVCFIKEWLKDEDMRKFETMDCYPDVMKCPDDVFNLWTPFVCEKYSCSNVSPIQKCFVIEAFRKHVLILCDNKKEFQDIIVQFIAHIFQYPDIQPDLVPYFISLEGAGKGTLIRFIERMMGFNKMLSTSSPSKDCFGPHNELMQDAFFVELKEVKKGEMLGIKNEYKSLVTDGKININPKFYKPYAMKCYARLIGASNNEDAVPTSGSDRRNIILKCSDELIGNRKYIKMINKIIDNDSYIRVIYEYLLKVKNVPKKFDTAGLPKTEYHKILVEASEDYAMSWFKQFIIDCKYDPNINDMYRIKSSDLFKNYRSYVDDKLIKCDKNYLSFMKHFNIMDIDGVTTTHSKGKSYKKIDIKLLFKKLIKPDTEEPMSDQVADQVTDEDSCDEEDDLH